MKRSSEILSNAEKIQWEDLGNGVSRQILGWDNQMMMVKVGFEKGAEGILHQHFHSQTTYCAKGKFEFTIGDTKQVVNEGDGLYIPPNTLHGTVCMEKGILIDTFSPVREDFLV